VAGGEKWLVFLDEDGESLRSIPDVKIANLMPIRI
jgi:hypothetical protein